MTFKLRSLPCDQVDRVKYKRLKNPKNFSNKKNAHLLAHLRVFY